MDINNLVGMANRIGDFFQSFPNRAEAKSSIALHISQTWAPRMREALMSHVDQIPASDLHDIVREALKENLELLKRKSPSTPAQPLVK